LYAKPFARLLRLDSLSIDSSLSGALRHRLALSVASGRFTAFLASSLRALKA
jgi:hypothetical protein